MRIRVNTLTKKAAEDYPEAMLMRKEKHGFHDFSGRVCRDELAAAGAAARPHVDTEHGTAGVPAFPAGTSADRIRMQRVFLYHVS